MVKITKLTSFSPTEYRCLSHKVSLLQKSEVFQLGNYLSTIKINRIKQYNNVERMPS